MNKWDSDYRDPRISKELEDVLEAGFQKTMADSRRIVAKLHATRRVCASCEGNRIVARDGYSEEEWAKEIGISRCDACIWRENFNAQFS